MPKYEVTVEETREPVIYTMIVESETPPILESMRFMSNPVLIRTITKVEEVE